MPLTIIFSFLSFLALFVLIGLLSSRQKKNTSNDYLVASQNIPDWLAALSAVATNNSGWMFIGMIGYGYMNGLSSIWILFAWALGDLTASFFFHKPFQASAQSNKASSYSEVMGKWQSGINFKNYRLITGILITVFLSIYAAAQLKAGSKALHVLLNWDISVGAIICAVLVVAYCFAGGIRASIWTDAAQSVVMMLAMTLLFIFSVLDLGSLQLFIQALSQVSDSYLNLFPNLPFGIFGIVAFILGWFLAGCGVAGQPHVMVRFMTLKPNHNWFKIRLYYYGWYFAFNSLTFLVALSARLLIPSTSGFDAELALPLLSLELFPSVLIGLILAGIFAGTMSTADSQILSCTAAISQDIVKKASLSFTKVITLSVTLFALVIALFAPANVFNLMLIAWSGLACIFTPLMILYILKIKVLEFQAILMASASLITIIIWQALQLNRYITEILPGMIIAFIVFYLSFLFFNKKKSF